MDEALRALLTEMQQLKNNIVSSTNKANINEQLEQLIGWAQTISTENVTFHDGDSGYSAEERLKSFIQLRSEIAAIQQNVSADIKTIRFQACSSILLFMLTVIPTGMEETNIFIDALHKKYVIDPAKEQVKP